MRTKLFLFGAVLAFLLVAFLTQNNQTEATPTDSSYCKKSIQFTQRLSYGGTLSDVFRIQQNGDGSRHEYFTILSPEIEGKLVGIKEMKILGAHHSTGSGVCNLIVNNTICHNFPAPPIGTAFTVSLPSCVNQLDLQGVNNVTLDCANVPSTNINIQRIIYEGVWNSCA